MADQAAHHYLTRDVDYGREDIKWHTGILVIETDNSAVVLGELREPSKKLSGNECRVCQQRGHIARECPNKEKMQRCRNCDEPGHHKSQCPSVLCSNCEQQGHLQNACPEPRRCRVCRGEGHEAKDCPSNPRRKGKQKRDGTACTSCGQEGHAAANCNDQKCTNCGECGHLLADCMAGPKNNTSTPAVPQSKPSAATTSKSTAAGPSKWLETGSVVDPTPTTGNEGEPTCADGEEEKMTAPSGTLPLDDGSSETLTARFFTNLSPQHISCIGFRFEGSYNNPDTRSGREHKSASLAFLHKNLDGNLACSRLEPTDEIFTKHLRTEQVEMAQKELAADPESSLYVLHIPVRTDGGDSGYGSNEADRPLYGQAIFADLDLGPFTDTFRLARGKLSGRGVIHLRFFTVTRPYVESRLDEVMMSMAAQNRQSSLRAWWAGGRVNPQAGMQMRAVDRPAGFQVHKRYNFFNKEEYFTIHFQNLVSELEAITKKGYAPTTIRIASFSGGGDQLYFAHIRMPADAHFRVGSVLDVKLAGPDEDDSNDWKFHLIEPMPITLAHEYAGYLFRPRLGQTFAALPAFEENVHFVAAGRFQGSTEMREAMGDLAGIRCYVREHLPNVGVRRAINTLNHLYLGGDAFAQEMRLLLTNNLMNLPTVDYFANILRLRGPHIVAREVKYLQARFGVEQQQVIERLRHMKAGVLLVQGPGGVGKSEILTALAVSHYRVRTDQPPNKKVPAVWVVSPINKQLDELTRKIFDRCEEERGRLEAQNLVAHAPIVIRRHMGSTEKRVYRRQADTERDRSRREAKPSYWEGVSDDEGEINTGRHESEDEQRMRQFAMSLVTERRLQMEYIRSNATAFDKRLQLEDLSEGRWVLRRAGYPDPDGTLHPIADPVKHAEFCRLLQRWASGEDVTNDDMTQLTLLANQIVQELAGMADIITMTPDVVSQTRAHKPSSPAAVMHDETGKAAEYGTLAAIAFSRPYNNSNGPLAVSPETHVPHIIFGDIFQPNPVLGHDASFHPFGQQNSVSLFQRFVIGGLDTVWLYEQHRSNSDIISLVNFILPRGQMRVAPGVDDRPESVLASQCATEIFDVSKRVIFMSIPGETETLHTTKSRYNDSFISPAWKIVFELLGKGFMPSQIAIISAYTAQVAAYRFVQQALIEWCMAQPADSTEYRLARAIGEIECFTIDKMQGAQKEVIIHCTTNSGALGFTLDTTRQLLANGRARSLLIILGDHPNVQRAYTGQKRNLYTKSAYYKAVVWCKENSTYINLHLHKKRLEFWQLQNFPMEDTLIAFRRAVTSGRTPISIDAAAEWDEPEEGDRGEENGSGFGGGEFGGGGFAVGEYSGERNGGGPGGEEHSGESEAERSGDGLVDDNGEDGGLISMGWG